MIKREEFFDEVSKKLAKDHEALRERVLSTLTESEVARRQVTKMAVACPNDPNLPDTFYICQATFDQVGGGLVFGQSGRYIFTENIEFGSQYTTDFAIAILGQDIVVDFNDFTLQYTGDVTNYILGIGALDSSNITIKNGTIRDFTRFGIGFLDSKQIVIENTHIIRNGPRYPDPNFNNEVVLPDLLNPDQLSISGGGIIVLGSTEINIVHNNVYENAGFGIGFSNSYNIYTDHNHVDDNHSFFFPSSFPGSPGYNTCYPFSLTYTNEPFNNANGSVVIKNSTFNRNQAIDFLFVIAMFAIIDQGQPPTKNVLIEDCRIYQNKTTNVTPAAGTFTIGVIAVGENVVARRVTVSDISNSDTIDASIEVQGLECGGYSAVIEDCVVQDVYGSCRQENMTGINSELLVENVVVKNCKVSRVKNAGSNDAAAFNFNERVGFPGIADYGAIGVTILDCVAQDARSTREGEGFAGIGFSFNSLIEGKVKNCISQNNEIGFRFLDIGELDRIPPIPPIPSNANVLEGNEAIGNSRYGFLDETPYANNAYINNIARGSGENNFVGLPDNTPIVEWVIGKGPCLFTQPFDNLSITSRTCTDGK